MRARLVLALYHRIVLQLSHERKDEHVEYINGLVQDYINSSALAMELLQCSNSIANALESLQFCTKSSISYAYIMSIVQNNQCQ